MTTTYRCRNLLVTGGCGFIGSNFVNKLVRTHGDDLRFVVNVDKLAYCADPHNIDPDVRASPKYVFVRGDILDFALLSSLLAKYDIDTVMHFAAESHVDNSFQNALAFTKTNVEGTHTLLEACRQSGKIKRFVHVSTDEVYGELLSGRSTEQSVLCPTNPYAASKAAAEMIARSYLHSFHFPLIITRGNNVYGPRQYPEKLIPKFITQILNGDKCTVHGRGHSVRNFLYVDDVVDAFLAILEHGRVGRIYNIGTECEKSVCDVAHAILQVLRPDANLSDWIEYTPDRCFNDRRYSIDSDALRGLGWTEKTDFASGLRQTIEWLRHKTFSVPPVYETQAAHVCLANE